MPLEVIRLGSVRDVVERVAADPGARFVGGGTLAVRDVNSGDVGIRALIFSDGLGLDRIEVGGDRVEIGAAATMAKVANHPALGFLKPVATSIGGPAVRNMATVGGNLFAPYPYGDFAVALLALGTSIKIETPSGTADLDVEDFLARRGEMGDAVVRSVAFTLPDPKIFSFVKALRRRPHGDSVLSIAALLPTAEGRISGARIAYGAMAPTAMRARAVERALEGEVLDESTISAATEAAIATAGCAPLDDPQASAWYRRSVLPVHLRRLLDEMKDGATTTRQRGDDASTTRRR